MHHSARFNGWPAVFLPVCFALGCTTADTVRPSDARTAGPAKEEPSEPSAANSALLARMTADAEDLPNIATKIAASGDKAAIKIAGKRLVALAKDTGAPSWRDGHRDEFRAANAPVAATASDGELEMALTGWQTENLAPILVAMDAIGGEDVVDFAIGEASDRTLMLDRRLLALALLERHVDRSDAARSPRIATIASELDGLAQSERAARLAKEDVARTLEGMTGDVRACATEALKAQPKLNTQGILVLSVAADGTVTEAKTTDLQPDTLARCVERAGKKVKFSGSPTGNAFMLRIPMNFHPR